MIEDARETSMRPARKGPENLQRLRRAQVVAARTSMRPARKGPENRHRRRDGDDVGRTSMRPARKGPENQVPPIRVLGHCHDFNEAGPQGAGKPGSRASDWAISARLQ